MNELEAL